MHLFHVLLALSLRKACFRAASGEAMLLTQLCRPGRIAWHAFLSAASSFRGINAYRFFYDHMKQIDVIGPEMIHF